MQTGKWKSAFTKSGVKPVACGASISGKHELHRCHFSWNIFPFWIHAKNVLKQSTMLNGGNTHKDWLFYIINYTVQHFWAINHKIARNFDAWLLWGFSGKPKTSNNFWTAENRRHQSTTDGQSMTKKKKIEYWRHLRTILPQALLHRADKTDSGSIVLRWQPNTVI